MRRHGVSIAGTGGHLLVGAVVAALVVGACGTGASPSAVSVPERVKAAGAVVWCSDTTYPPFESVAADGTTPEGLDIDIAAEIARRWGVTSDVRATYWDALLNDLNAGKCDLVISSMTSTFGGRADQADFVDYLQTWLAFLVAPGNPEGIITLEDLAGRSVAVTPGLTSEATLRAASDELVAAGKPPIEIITAQRPAETWVKYLGSGDVDALAGDSVEVVYQAGKPPYAGASEVGGPAIDPQPLGIAIRKDDAGMKEAVAAAIDAMYADGTMQSVVEKWGMTDAVQLLQ